MDKLPAHTLEPQLTRNRQQRGHIMTLYVCNCEHEMHFDEPFDFPQETWPSETVEAHEAHKAHPYCSQAPGTHNALYVGAVCTWCWEDHMKDFVY